MQKYYFLCCRWLLLMPSTSSSLSTSSFYVMIQSVFCILNKVIFLSFGNHKTANKCRYIHIVRMLCVLRLLFVLPPPSLYFGWRWNLCFDHIAVLCIQGTRFTCSLLYVFNGYTSYNSISCARATPLFAIFGAHPLSFSTTTRMRL